MMIVSFSRRPSFICVVVALAWMLGKTTRSTCSSSAFVLFSPLFGCKNSLYSKSGSTGSTIRVVPQTTLHAVTKLSEADRNPKKWNRDTKPFVVVRYFAGNGVTDEKIKKALASRSITTLEELRNDATEVVWPLIPTGARRSFILAVEDAYQRVGQTPEEKLGGICIFDDKCISQSSFDLYSEEAVSVYPDKKPMDEDDRMHDFSLVMGGSGSGKTLFALRYLPKLLCDGTTKNCFCVHFQVNEVISAMDGYKHDFPVGVESVVQEKIRSKLAELELDELKKVNLFLNVILDEAGSEEYLCYFDTAKNVEKIVKAIKTQLPYNFKRGVHLTIVGSGLEVTTRGIATTVETTKYKMQPWTMVNFEALVDASDQPRKADVKNIFRSFPILQDLATNARCAFYLLRSMKRIWFLGKNRQKSFAKVLVATVAERYIESNGLRYLRGAAANWELARSVFKELDKATSQRNVPFFPTFEDLTNLEHRFTARSLVETNVESSQGRLEFANISYPYAVSMSPAIAIVMANLLNTEADISWDWQGFESTVMLSELKYLVVHAQSRPNRLDRLVMELPFPLPSSNTTYSVPEVGDSTVILNGRNAAYADVIAPFRLVQAKFSSDDSSSKSFNITKELSKMGLLYGTSEHLLQQYLTQTLYDKWKEAAEIPNPVVEATTHSVNKEYRYQCYPFNTLNAKRISEMPVVIEGKLLKEATEIEGVLENEYVMTMAGARISPSVVSRVFDEKHPVTAVFCTNCKSFALTKMNFTIEPEDVDWEGKLITKVLPEDAIRGLRENVEIRFLFF